MEEEERSNNERKQGQYARLLGGVPNHQSKENVGVTQIACLPARPSFYCS